MLLEIKKPLNQVKTQFQEFKKKPYSPASFFLAGFIFDILTLNRIDSLFQTIQITCYLLLLSLLIYWKVLYEHGLFHPSQRLQKVWKHHVLLTQFIMGALLSIYTLFFFKSASLLTSILFMLFIAALFVANEFVKLKKHQLLLTLSLYFLSLTCYWITLVPVFIGSVGFIPFLISLVGAILSTYFFHWLIQKRVSKANASPPVSSLEVRKKITYSSGGVILLLLVSYYFQLIPPVPLSIQYLGIFHNIRKIEGRYELDYNRPFWKFWQNGDQSFYAKEGDVIFNFAQIFAPNRFKDELFARWLLKTNQGWRQQDLISFKISGGRDEGFRGFTQKSNYQAGDYRVQIETNDGREIGRINFKVIPDPPNKNRKIRTLIK